MFFFVLGFVILLKTATEIVTTYYYFSNDNGNKFLFKIGNK